jgi:ADP-ribose pyrophosphatase YjhB (NUDIX family)
MTFSLDISDEDISSEHDFSCSEFVIRPTVRCIVLKNKNKIGLVTNPIHNLFTLPGGGIEKDESTQEAVVREMREELSSEIEEIELIGDALEQRARNCKHYKTKVFKASFLKENLIDKRTKNEKDLKMMPVWKNLEEVEGIFNQQMEKLNQGKINYYNTSFNIYRDTIFLKEYLNNNN